MYCFTELEFLLSDYRIMNYYTSSSPKVFLSGEIVCTKMLESGDKISGVIIVQGNLK